MGGEARAPRVWALLGRRAGDNAQVEALAEALGEPWAAKRLVWRGPRRWTPLYGRMGPSLSPLAPESRAAVSGPPWPALVLSVGWRSVPVARWIGRAGGARLVHLGRPRAPLPAFDLVLTTPQYPLPEAANLVRLEGPLSRLSPEALAAAGARWRERLEALPRPWIALLVGGNAGPWRLTPEAAAALGARATALAAARGGALLVATGPRTPRAAAAALVARLEGPRHVWLWGEAGENPYAGFLALADEIVVTADSVSMAHEAGLTGRPLHLFRLPERRGPLAQAARALDERGGRAYAALLRGGWLYPPRRIDRFMARLVARGAAWLGEGEPRPVAPAGGEDRMRAAAAARALLAPDEAR